MKIASLEHLHADAGQRNFDFLKITADNGLVGWSEYNESFGGLGVSAVIDGLAPMVIGRDPRAYEAVGTQLYAVRRQASISSRCVNVRSSIAASPSARLAVCTALPAARRRRFARP